MPDSDIELRGGPGQRAAPACGSCRICGRTERAHKILGKPRGNGFPQAITRLHPVSCSKTTGTRTAQIAQNSPTDFPEEAYFQARNGLNLNNSRVSEFL